MVRKNTTEVSFLLLVVLELIPQLALIGRFEDICIEFVKRIKYKGHMFTAQIYNRNPFMTSK